MRNIWTPTDARIAKLWGIVLGDRPTDLHPATEDDFAPTALSANGRNVTAWLISPAHFGRLISGRNAAEETAGQRLRRIDELERKLTLAQVVIWMLAAFALAFGVMVATAWRLI